MEKRITTNAKSQTFIQRRGMKHYQQYHTSKDFKLQSQRRIDQRSFSDVS